MSHYGINKNVRCNWTQGQQRPVVAEFRGGWSATTGFFKGSERKAVSGTSKVDFSLWIAGWHDIFPATFLIWEARHSWGSKITEVG